jgi:dipeptide transport system ATP-binding protein
MACAMRLIPVCGKADIMALLDIQNLSVDFRTRSGWFRAVDGVSLSVKEGQVHAVVGESGSGKSVAMLAVMGLLPKTAKVTADHVQFNGHDLLSLDSKSRRTIIGKDMAMIFQEPMTSLNPCFTVGYQIGEALKTHLGMDKAARRARIIELLASVGIPDPESRLNAFPHQFSGGMAQRVMIAMALSCNPKLIIADEPTTALDVTIQAQILDLLTSLQKKTGTALVLITHSMGVVAEIAETVSVNYAGQKVEEGRVDAVFSVPRHPYTAALLQALPERSRKGEALRSIAGTVPGQFDRPTGCLFAPRCQFAEALCHNTPPTYSLGARCHFPLNRSVAT